MNSTQLNMISRILDNNKSISFICDSNFNIIFVNSCGLNGTPPIQPNTNLYDLFVDIHHDLDLAKKRIHFGVPFCSTKFVFNLQEISIFFHPIMNDYGTNCDSILCSFVSDPRPSLPKDSDIYFDKVNAIKRQNVSNIIYMLYPIASKLQELEQYDSLEILNKLTHNCYSILKVNANLNLYNRLIHYKDSLTLGPVILNELIESFCRSLQVLMSGIGFKIEVDLPEKAIITMLDEEKFIEVLINIFSNSCKFSPSGSTIKLSLKQINDNINISIQDEGIGIPPESIDKVFNPYFTCGDSSFEGQGLGLGLCLVKKIIELHKGTVFLTSTVNKGTTVGISFPVNDTIPASYTFKSNKPNYIANRFSSLYINFAQICDITFF